jgi:sugar O-acyltransferase (sialic acid O-acetyltransferase NeuD family)
VSDIKSIYFLGYSGHAYVAIEVAQANGLSVVGYMDKTESRSNPFKIPYYGYEKDNEFSTWIRDAYVFPAVGDNSVRKKLHQLLIEENTRQITLIAPSAYVSNSVTIGLSTLISPNATINSLSIIGNGCIINTASIVEHECVVEDYTHVAPGAVLAGNVKIGKNCFIGANAVIKQGISIADNVIIGAGAVVLKDIEENGIWVGNPAKLLPIK